MNTMDRKSQAFFEARYQASSDPWQFASCAYELDRYQARLGGHSTLDRDPSCGVQNDGQLIPT